MGVLNSVLLTGGTMSARYVNTLLTAIIMILVSMNGVLDFSEKEIETPELL